MTYRATMNLGGRSNFLRAKSLPRLWEVVEICWTDVNETDRKKLEAGEIVQVTGFGNWNVREVPSVEAPCGECMNCKFKLGKECIEK